MSSGRFRPFCLCLNVLTNKAGPPGDPVADRDYQVLVISTATDVTTWISNYIQQNLDGCNYLSMP